MRKFIAIAAIAIPGLATAADGDIDKYRQWAASIPVYSVTAERGHPWRMMYGYPLTKGRRLSVHQDWVLSWLDADTWDGAPGGTGLGVGTDLVLQWRFREGTAPYVEFGAGVQYAFLNAFPADGGRWMLPVNFGLGLLIPMKDKQLNTSIRYVHVSNAYVFKGNSGYDAIHLLIGVRWQP